ncbi:uncharacterized protein [Epargyreus clarus]|uniref:uncharacterized protein n=1 Tax=Epargyreus clarus TaxID=520877 RepID=UPI003C30DBD1
MADILPLTLVGHTLGERLHSLNSTVNNAYQQNIPLQSVLDQPELSPIDRIFKIELASKHKDVEYIIKNLKDKDMLYVSRALKSHWLLQPEYSHIINPLYLESHLYPEMTTTAVNKMKNYIELNLKDPERCLEFYKYYKSNFDVAIKFLWHCSKDVITDQFVSTMDKLTPKYLRILCEACPQVAKLYFDGLKNSKAAYVRYIKSNVKYHNSIMSVLKADGNLFLDLIEKYFDKNLLKPFNPSITRYIMKNYKNRYLTKPELYTAWFLHNKTQATFLNCDEIKDIVFRLARAKYLGLSFKYKNAEPFLKRLCVQERESIKKQIFVDKSFGSEIDTWPYPPPERLKLHEPVYDPFDDVGHDEQPSANWRSMLKKRKFTKSGMCHMEMCMSHKSTLDTLYDRYRFMNFDKVFFEFRKLLLIEGTIEGRRSMILVLVSKAGSNETKLKQLLNFLVDRHSNEAENLRDAVARSMVKRAFAWRLQAETWELLLKWANTSVREILHATILRHLLADSACPQTDLEAYLRDFSDLTEYSLNGDEKVIVAKRLPALLITANEPNKFLDTLKAYNLRVNTIPGAEEMLISAAREDETTLRRVYQLRIARKHLLVESFKINQTDAAYMNALKHDVSVLANGESFITLLSKEKSNHDRFLRSLVLYFSDPDGLSVQHLNALDKAISENCRVSFARPFAFLVNASNKSLEDYITKTDGKTGITQKKFAAALRANALIARPQIDIDVIDWRVIGAKFISNKVLVCSDKDVDKYIQKCLKWKKTMPVALRLSPRIDSLHEVLLTVIEARPTKAVKFVLAELRKGAVDTYNWKQIKLIILKLDLTKTSMQYVRRILGDLSLETNIDAEYWTTVFKVFLKANEEEAMPMLCKIENALTDVEDDSLNDIILNFIRDKLNKDIITDEQNLSSICLYFRVIAKYLLISQSEEEQKAKIKNVCDPFFDKIEMIYKELQDKSKLIECLDDFLFAMKYTKAFLNNKYVSCIPMFQRILERMGRILPREKYFEKYVYMHLTMLYCRSIRQVMKQKPEVLHKPMRQDEGTRAVGFVFGKYISIELRDLVKNYFKSII